MELSEIVRISEKGELVIPQHIMDSVGIVEKMHVIIRADVNNREIKIIPFTTSEGNLVEFKITLADMPGALAKCAAFLSEHGLNLVASESRTIQHGEIAHWYVIADISNCKENIRDLCKKLKNKGLATEVVCSSIH